MKEEERSEEYYLDPDSPEVMDEIIAQERTDYIKRPASIVLLLIVLLSFLFQTPVARAGGPKCDRPDTAKCGMANCKMKRGETSCSNICHKGCCYCPDGKDPLEGPACPRDEPQGQTNPDEGSPQ